MIKHMLALTALGGAALAALPVTAQTSYGYAPSQTRNVQCERQRDDDKMAGTVVGAVVGGLIGGAIGNEIADDDNDRYRDRRYNRYNRYNRYYRYDRRYDRHYRRNDDNDGEVIAGALIGAVIGGIAGSSIAEDSADPCRVASPQNSRYPDGGIPRTTDGLYGGPEVMREPSSYPSSTRTYPASGSSYPERRTTTTYPTYPAEPVQECRTIYRETRLPDGRVERDPVTACRDGQNGEWRVENDTYDDVYGY